MSNTKRTKIVATLGPSCESKQIIKDMMLFGVDVFRVNFSHANFEIVQKSINYIRCLNEELGLNTAILADLQGPKLRVGVMKKEILLKKGDIFSFTSEECEGTQGRAYMTYKNFPKDVKVNEEILVDDGKLLFKVIKTDKNKIVTTKVIRGGLLRSKKGVNLPNTNISLPALTEKDVKDALFAIKNQFDWIALSFVRKVNDLLELHNLIKNHSEHKIPVIAKIEKPSAIENLESLIAYCDGIMVARGDLGVELPMQEVPLIQKRLVLRAKQARIPVIIATQMMESMIQSQIPTRAEVNDVANSIIDGADAVMLSGETSVGDFPVSVIKQMYNIIVSVENCPSIVVPRTPPYIKTKRFITKAICHHAALVSDNIDASVIATMTNSGYTAFQISAWRPKAHIIAFTSNKRILTTLSLLWGVKAYYYNRMISTDETVEDINAFLKEKGHASKGSFVINLSSMPQKDKGMVNTLRISEL